jgi:ferrous iron transport protein A
MGLSGPAGARSLADLAVGEYGVLAEPRVSGSHRTRLAELGFRPGETVRLTQRSVGGARVIAVHGSRIAIDADTARALVLEAQP